MIRALVLLSVAAGVMVAERPEIPREEYAQRRASLRRSMGDSVLILFGGSEKDGGDLRSGFFQEANFYYLTGWNEPGAALVLTPKSEVLFLPRRNAMQERWTGPKAAPGDANISEVTGFKQVFPMESLEARLPSLLEEGTDVFTLLGSPQAANLKALLPLREVREAAGLISQLRVVKSAAEIAMIEHATKVGMMAHRAAWRTAKPGLREYQVASAMTNLYSDAGCERHAYHPIVGSGGNAAVLHYSKNSRRMDSGELLLMDVGPECGMYATDITRTVPVNGKFTDRQRELYEVVLGALKAATSAVKPSAVLGHSSVRAGLHQIAFDYINTHGKDKQGEPLGKYFIHGIGHHVGLDVHDPGSYTAPLRENMVITLEPGIYIPEENIGIRIEDMVLVTKDGARVLTRDLPRTPDEVERAIAAR